MLDLYVERWFLEFDMVVYVLVCFFNLIEWFFRGVYEVKRWFAKIDEFLCWNRLGSRVSAILFNPEVYGIFGGLLIY